MSTEMYGVGRDIEGQNFDDIAQKLRDELQKFGFGVLFEIPVNEKVKGALDLDMRRYLIMGACNPKLAHAAAEAEEDVGLLLPCNLLVQQKAENTVRVSIIDAKKMLNIVGNEALTPLGEQAAEALNSVLASV